MSDKTKTANKSIAVCLHNTSQQRSEKSSMLHLSNECKWMMIVGPWERRCNLTAGWPSLMQNRAAHANAHLLRVRGWGAPSHSSRSAITFDDTWFLPVAVFVSWSLSQMFYLSGRGGRYEGVKLMLLQALMCILILSDGISPGVITEQSFKSDWRLFNYITLAPRVSSRWVFTLRFCVFCEHVLSLTWLHSHFSGLRASVTSAESPSDTCFHASANNHLTSTYWIFTSLQQMLTTNQTVTFLLK